MTNPSEDETQPRIPISHQARLRRLKQDLEWAAAQDRLQIESAGTLLHSLDGVERRNGRLRIMLDLVSDEEPE